MPDQNKPNDRKRTTLVIAALKAAFSGIFQAVTRWLLENLV